jgi:hypothetical protein
MRTKNKILWFVETINSQFCEYKSVGRNIALYICRSQDSNFEFFYLFTLIDEFLVDKLFLEKTINTLNNLTSIDLL